MQSSDTIGKLAAALSAAQGEFPVVEKKSANPFFSSKYADLAEVAKATVPILAKNGLSIVQAPGWDGEKHLLSTRLMHTSGEWIENTMALMPVKNDPQAQGSAITYARRYAYSAILGIVTEADDDGNAASQPKAQAGEAAPAPTRRPSPKPKTVETAVETITRPQLTKLSVQFKELTNLGEPGFADRDERLEQVGALVGKKIASSNDLTKDEASRVIDLLDQQIAALKKSKQEFDEDF